MKIFTKEDLIQEGYTTSHPLELMLAETIKLQQRGIKDHRYIIKQLKRRFGKTPPNIALRKNPLPLREAITIRSKNTEEVENLTKVRQQLHELLRIPVVKDAAIMPDTCPTSKELATLTVGGIIATDRAIIPSAHSSDICCSMHASFFYSEKTPSQQLDALEKITRFGPGGRPREQWIDHPVLHEDIWSNVFLKGLRDKASMHLADQGDGNHFASIGKLSLSDAQRTTLKNAGYESLVQSLDSTSSEIYVLVTHHGSRSLGAHVYKRGQVAAEKQTAKIAEDIPRAAAWLDTDSDEGQQYWEALQYIRRWTKANHELIHSRFLKSIQSTELYSLGNEHNFVWKKDQYYYHAKGATPAWKDSESKPLLGLIPLNMAEPILLVLGRDNQDYLSFAPHGAGRNISRTKLLRKFSHKSGRIDSDSIQNTIQEHTKDIDVRWYSGKPDLTETPIAYKFAKEVRAQIESFDLATIVAEIHPLGCIMAGRQKSWKELRAETLSPKQKRQIQHRSERRTNRQNLRQHTEI